MPVTGETLASTVSVGGAVIVSSPGFAQNESYEIWLHSTPVKLGSGIASANGTVRQTVSIPAGSHRFKIRGAQSGSVWTPIQIQPSLASTGANATPVLLGAGFLLFSGAALLFWQLAKRRRVTVS